MKWFSPVCDVTMINRCCLANTQVHQSSEPSDDTIDTKCHLSHTGWRLKNLLELGTKKDQRRTENQSISIRIEPQSLFTDYDPPAEIHAEPLIIQRRDGSVRMFRMRRATPRGTWTTDGWRRGVKLKDRNGQMELLSWETVCFHSSRSISMSSPEETVNI